MLKLKRIKIIIIFINVIEMQLPFFLHNQK